MNYYTSYYVFLSTELLSILRKYISKVSKRVKKRKLKDTKSERWEKWMPVI